MENAHVQRKTEEVCEAVRKISGKQAPSVRVIKGKDGKVLTDQKEISNRWLEHFRQLHKPCIDTDETVFAEIPARNPASTDCPRLLRVEVEKAIRELTKDKSPGVDNIIAEEIQATGQGELMHYMCCVLGSGRRSVSPRIGRNQ